MQLRVVAGNVDHKYKDNYQLAADLMTNMAIVTLASVLEQFGLTKKVLRRMDKSKEPTLWFSLLLHDRMVLCAFVKEEIVVDESLPFVKETHRNQQPSQQNLRQGKLLPKSQQSKRS